MDEALKMMDAGTVVKLGVPKAGCSAAVGEEQKRERLARQHVWRLERQATG